MVLMAVGYVETLVLRGGAEADLRRSEEISPFGGQLGLSISQHRVNPRNSSLEADDPRSNWPCKIFFSVQICLKSPRPPARLATSRSCRLARYRTFP